MIPLSMDSLIGFWRVGAELCSDHFSARGFSIGVYCLARARPPPKYVFAQSNNTFSNLDDFFPESTLNVHGGFIGESINGESTCEGNVTTTWNWTTFKHTLCVSTTGMSLNKGWIWAFPNHSLHFISLLFKCKNLHYKSQPLILYYLNIVLLPWSISQSILMSPCLNKGNLNQLNALT